MMHDSFWMALREAWRSDGQRYVIEGLFLALIVVLLLNLNLLPGPYWNSEVDGVRRLYLSDLCLAEAKEMDRHAAACRDFASRGVDWSSDDSDRVNDLKICPYPDDSPRSPTWWEQAKVWERAAARCRTAARLCKGRAL